MTNTMMNAHTVLIGDASDKLYIRSAVPTTSKIYSELANVSTRATALKSLPPLPDPVLPQQSFPEFTLTSYCEILPLPPRSGLPPKPPLPPRPGAKAPPTQNASRISNPFASFFTKTTTPSSSPALLPSDPHLVDHIVEVSAFTIDRPVIRRIVVKALTKAIKNDIKESLGSVPTWVIDRVNAFCSSMIPFPKTQRMSREGTAVDRIVPAYTVSLYEELPDELEDAFQAFYDALEEELKVDGVAATFRRREDKHVNDETARSKDKTIHDTRTRDILERVERTLCSVFYDRYVRFPTILDGCAYCMCSSLFRPSNSDDAQHDEALSSRIAALNMLDVTLVHLGVDVGEASVDVDSVVRASGESQ